jgi:hypothetical protein
MAYDPTERADEMRRGAGVSLGRVATLESADALILDGNAVAALIEEVFGWDLTAELAQCASCWNVAEGGTLLAFVGGPGTVLRCSVCHEVVIRIVRTAEATYVDARGAAFLRLPGPTAG